MASETSRREKGEKINGWCAPSFQVLGFHRGTARELARSPGNLQGRPTILHVIRLVAAPGCGEKIDTLSEQAIPHEKIGTI